MKKILALFIALICATTMMAQTGSELITYRTASGDVGSFTITQIRGTQLTANLTALDALSGTGYSVRTGTNAWALRTFGVGSNKLSVSNADGVSGNTSYDVNEANLALNNIGGTLSVSKGGTGATTLTGYLIGNGTGAFTASSTIPFTALSGAATVAQLPTNIPNANLANSAITINGTSVSLGGTRNISLQEAIAISGTVTGNIASSGQLSVTGGFGLGTETVTATGTEGIPNSRVYCNAGASDITRTLPASPPFVGYMKSYKRINTTAGNTIIVPNSGQTLSTTAQQQRLVSVDAEVKFIWQGSNVWQVHFN